MKDFRRLAVWSKAHTLTLDVYRTTEAFPSAERFGLTSQIRRSAASIPANIAEGCGREGDSEFARFLQIALGSATELDYHLLLAHDLGSVKEDVYVRLSELLAETKQMLFSLYRKVCLTRPKTKRLESVHSRVGED